MKNKIPFANPLPEINLAIDSVINAGKSIMKIYDQPFEAKIKLDNENLLGKIGISYSQQRVEDNMILKTGTETLDIDYLSKKHILDLEMSNLFLFQK